MIVGPGEVGEDLDLGGPFVPVTGPLPATAPVNESTAAAGIGAGFLRVRVLD